jgi:hypothetical protein
LRCKFGLKTLSGAIFGRMIQCAALVALITVSAAVDETTSHFAVVRGEQDQRRRNKHPTEQEREQRAVNAYSDGLSRSFVGHRGK